MEQTILRIESASQGQETKLQTGIGITFDDLMIRTKDKRLVQLVPNVVQESYLDDIAPLWRKGVYDIEGLREMILKARQFGFSTIIEALLFCDTLNTPNTETVVIANDADTTKKIFRIVKRFYDNLPADKKPATKYASKTEFYWPEIGSSFYVGTAGAREFGRGTTVSNVHATEVAFWPDAASLVASLLEAVPDNGSIWLESTANGLGNYFHTEWESAENGDSVFTHRFYAWFTHNEYRLPCAPDFEPTKEERETKERYHVDNEQINWYRVKKKGLRGKVVQEYPSNAREAFLSTGNPYFDRDVLEEFEQSCVKSLPASSYDFLLDGHTRLKVLSAAEEDSSNRFEVWQPPQAGRRYIVSADPSEGLDGEGDHDYCSADVIDAETWEQVATLHGRWDPHEFGMMLGELGTWYNFALVVVERNNHGHAVLNALIHSYGYPKMDGGIFGGVYCHEEFDEKKKQNQKRPGWPTTPKTKNFALDQLSTAILVRDVIIRSLATVRELMRYVKMAGGKSGGDGGSHDDRVISLALAIATIQHAKSHIGSTAPVAVTISTAVSEYDPR